MHKQNNVNITKVNNFLVSLMNDLVRIEEVDIDDIAHSKSAEKLYYLRLQKNIIVHLITKYKIFHSNGSTTFT